MNQQEQEKIRELLLEWSRLEPARIDVDYDEGFAGGAVRISGNWYGFDEDIFPEQAAVIQAAIREACEAKGLTLRTESWLAGDWYYHDVRISLGLKQIITEGDNLTLAMLECWVEVLRGRG